LRKQALFLRPSKRLQIDYKVSTIVAILLSIL